MTKRKRKRTRRKKRIKDKAKPLAQPTVVVSREGASNSGEIEVPRLETSDIPKNVQISPQETPIPLRSKRVSSLKAVTCREADGACQEPLVPLSAVEPLPVEAGTHLEVDAPQENLVPPLSEIDATPLETGFARPDAAVQEIATPLHENRVASPETESAVEAVVAKRQDASDSAKETSQSYTKTRIIEVSAAELRENLVVAALEDEASAPSRVAYKMLRTQVLQRMVIKGWNTLGLTSPGPDQGKTLTVVNLAVTIAKEEQHTVMLVDLDLRRPSIYEYFNYAPEKGVEDHLLNGTPLDQILFNPGLDRLVVLPCKSPVVGSSELMASPKIAQFVRELKERYPSRYILFDLPPMLAGDDVLAFAPHLDTMLMVIKHGSTKKKELKNTMDLLGDVDILGSVLNDCNDHAGSYYYYY